MSGQNRVRGSAFIALLDNDIIENGLANRKGEPRSLLELRVRASKQFERYLVQLGMTPASRRELKVARPLDGTIAQLRAQHGLTE